MVVAIYSLLSQVTALRIGGVEFVSASASHHTLVRTRCGLAFGWGLNSRRQVGSVTNGLSSKLDRSTSAPLYAALFTLFVLRISVLLPRPVVLHSSSERHYRFRSVSCGEFHSAALTAESEVVLWGDCELADDLLGGQSEASVDVSPLLPPDKCEYVGEVVAAGSMLLVTFTS